MHIAFTHSKPFLLCSSSNSYTDSLENKKMNISYLEHRFPSNHRRSSIDPCDSRCHTLKHDTCSRNRFSLSTERKKKRKVMPYVKSKHNITFILHRLPKIKLYYYGTIFLPFSQLCTTPFSHSAYFSFRIVSFDYNKKLTIFPFQRYLIYEYR